MALINVFKINVVRKKNKKKIEKFHVLGNNLIEASFIAEDYVENTLSKQYDFAIEIKSIKRKNKIEGIRELNFIKSQQENIEGWSPTLFLQQSSTMLDAITFTCECGTEIKVISIDFPFINCPNCGIHIHGDDIEEVGGIYILNRKNKE